MATQGQFAVAETIQAANDFRVAGGQYKTVQATGDFGSANRFALGIMESKPNSGEYGSVVMCGVTKAYVGAAVASVGTLLSCAASGWLALTTSHGVARALETASSGDLIKVSVNFLAGSLT